MPSARLRHLLETVVYGNALDDGPLMAALDDFIHDKNNVMQERAFAVQKMDEVIGELKLPGETYNEQDVKEYVDLMKQVRDGSLPLNPPIGDDGSGN
jgi:hypothetical protein